MKTLLAILITIFLAIVSIYLLGCWITLDFRCYEIVLTTENHGGPLRYFTLIAVFGAYVMWSSFIHRTINKKK